jgi:hypothetical protein
VHKKAQNGQKKESAKNSDATRPGFSPFQIGHITAALNNSANNILKAKNCPPFWHCLENF